MKTLKRTLCLVLVAVMALSLFAVAASAKKLSDYDDAAAVSAEYQVAVDTATQLGILEGMGADTYGAKGTLTRAQLATMLYRMVTGKAKADNYGGSAFSDVKADAWYAGYVNYAADADLLEGVGNNKYNPSAALTGYETLAAFLRALGYGKNGEFVGATWKAGVVKYADVIDGDIVADWSKPISREVAAQLIYNTLKAPKVAYMFGNYVPFGGNLAKSVFDATYADKAVDNYGTPGEVWTTSKGVEIVKAAYPVVKSYTTYVSECDVLVDLGVAKTDLTTKVAYSAWDGAMKDYEEMTHANVACANNGFGGQGVLTRIYKDTKEANSYIITQNLTFLAKVTGTTAATHGAKATTTVQIYKARPETKVLTDVTGWAKGSFVLVTQSAANNNDVTIIGYAKSEVAKHVDVTYVPGTGEAIHTVGNGTYKLNVTAEYDYKTVPVVGGTYTWYFDQYNNIIGVAPYTAAVTYGIVDAIEWEQNVGDFGGYANAKLVYMNATPEVSKVTKIDNVATSVYNVSDMYERNGRYYNSIYTIADGKEIVDVGVEPDYAVNLKKGDPFLFGYNYQWYVADAETVYLYKFVDKAGVVSYKSYTGYGSAPSINGANVSFVDENDDLIVDYIYVYGGTLVDATTTVTGFLANDSHVKAYFAKDVQLFTYEIWVDGVKKDIVSDELGLFAGCEENTMVTVTFGSDTYADSAAPAVVPAVLYVGETAGHGTYYGLKTGVGTFELNIGAGWLTVTVDANAVVYTVKDGALTAVKYADLDEDAMAATFASSKNVAYDIVEGANNVVDGTDTIVAFYVW